MRGFYPKPRIVARYKHKVRLADGFNQQFELDHDSVQRGVECLHSFADQLLRFNPDVVCAVATAALRKAKNQTQILPQLEQALGHPISVISGEREAELIFSGVCAAAEQKGNILVIDIGGASTEVIAGRPLSPRVLNSFDMGCVVFQNHHFADGQITRQRFEHAVNQARQQVSSYTSAYQAAGWDHVLGASGTFRALAEIAMAEGQANLTRDWLAQLIERCVQTQQVERLNFVGLRDDRKAILCGGIAILMGVLSELGIDVFGVTNGALREGLLAEMVATETA